MTHEEETANFIGDPINDYCGECFCSHYFVDDECDCECHDAPDFGDGE